MYFEEMGDILVSRRRWIAACSAIGLPVLIFSPVIAASPDQTHDLSCADAIPEFRRVKIVVESSGHLLVKPVVGAVKGKVVNQESAPVRQVPFEVNVTQLFDERIVNQSADAAQSLRFYRDFEGQLKIAKTANKPEIAQERRWISARIDAEGRAFFCPLEPLKREELDLVDVPGNPLALNRLAPSKPVKVGDAWTHENSVLETLLGIDQVLEQKELQSKLAEVKNGVAVVSLTGAIVGAVQSARTQIHLQAKYNVDLKSHQVTWFALGMTEKRDLSAAQPGFESSTRIRLATMPIEPIAELDDANKDRMKLDDPLAGKLLTFESAKGGFKFIHDSRWFSMIDREDGSVLRLVDRGDLVAQCTITDLPKLSPGQRTSLAAFQAEIQGKLGKSFQGFVESRETPKENGVTMQRVAATALADDVAVHWIYYLAIRDDGRRVAMMFTYDANMAERFAAADLTLAGSLQLLDGTPVKAPAAAAQNPASSTTLK